MIKIAYTGVNTTKLHDELVAAGVTPAQVTSDAEYDHGSLVKSATTTWIAYADGTNMTTVAAVVAAHNPTPIVATHSLEQRLAIVEEDVNAVATFLGVVV